MVELTPWTRAATRADTAPAAAPGLVAQSDATRTVVFMSGTGTATAACWTRALAASTAASVTPRRASRVCSCWRARVSRPGQGAFLPAQEPGCLSTRSAFQAAKHEGGPVLLGQSVQLLLKHFLQFPPRHLGLCSLGRPGAGLP